MREHKIETWVSSCVILSIIVSEKAKITKRHKSQMQLKEIGKHGFLDMPEVGPSAGE
jgi:hypothetical protein